jgi:tetratricopeptide (TPR) repeat protein
MLIRAIKFIASMTVVAVIVLPISAVVVDDETVTELLKEIPGSFEQKNSIIKSKKLLASTIVNYSDDTLFSIELGLLELTDDTFSKFELAYQELFKILLPNRFTNKVVIYLPDESKLKTKSNFDKSPAQPVYKQLKEEPKIFAVHTSKTSASPKKVVPKKTLVPAVEERSKSAFQITSPKKVIKKKKQTKKINARIISAKEDHKRGLRYYKLKNFKKATKWFLQAAKKGYASAQYNLGIMSYLGQGIPKDYSQAANWFEKAGNQDHASAQYNLGYIYYEGKGVEKDNLQAYMWIDRSANLGDKKAIKARDSMQIVLPKDIFN